MIANKVEKKNNVVQLINVLEKHIAKRSEELHKKELEEEKELEEIKEKLAVLKKYRNRFPISDSEKKEISSILCFNNLGYCCKKECPWRNAVLEICGIDKKYFEVNKEYIGFALMTPSTSILIGSKENISESAVVEINRKIS